MKSEKCHFCKHDSAPHKRRSDVCIQCKSCNNFEIKIRMTDREKYEYTKLLEEEAWVNDRSVKFDKDTAVAVLDAIAKHLVATRDKHGEPILVMGRYRFEAIKQKFLY